MAKEAAPKNPLAEVFGFPTSNKTDLAKHYQSSRLCPFNNVVANCTKVSVVDPLGVCSLFDSDNNPTIVCPVRFKEDWLIVEQAAKFFFPDNAKWVAYPGASLKDEHGESVGNVYLKLVAYDDNGFEKDWGAVEILAPYDSQFAIRQMVAQLAFADGNIETANRKHLSYDITQKTREQLLTTIIPKHQALKSLNKKLAIAVEEKQFPQLGESEQVDVAGAEIVWLTFRLILNPPENRYRLTFRRCRHTTGDALNKLLTLKEAAVA